MIFLLKHEKICAIGSFLISISYFNIGIFLLNIKKTILPPYIQFD